MQVGQVQGVVQTVTHITHQHFYAAPVPQVEVPQPVVSTEPVKPQPSDEHREVLRLMKPLDQPVRVKVLEFMRREFKTAMVVELTPLQLRRLRGYVEAVKRNERGRQRA